MTMNKDDSTNNSSTHHVPVTLKWGKKTYTEEIFIEPGSQAKLLKHQIQTLTNVPIARQKLLSPKCWKGFLEDTDDLPTRLPKGKKTLPVTLIGSAEVLVETPLEDRPLFQEDMSAKELQEVKRQARLAAASTSAAGEGSEDDITIGDIVALQRAPEDRNDDKMDMYQYNRLVTGLPQRQIEDKLRVRRDRSKIGDEDDNDNDNDGKLNVEPSTTLLGEVAMTMGMELRRAYVNSLAVLRDGTLVSGLDDGHVHMWRRGELLKDTEHVGYDAGVDQVVSFHNSGGHVGVGEDVDVDADVDVDGPAFATGGRGSVQIWTIDGNCIRRFPSPQGTSPASLAIGRIPSDESTGMSSVSFLACCFKITRNPNPNQFRLVPQDEAGRRRREAAISQERTIQDSLVRSSQCVQVWFYRGGNSDGSAVGFGSLIIPPGNDESMAPVTNVAISNDKLVCGDDFGCLRVLECRRSSNSFGFRRVAYLQLQCAGFDLGISCMEPMRENLLIVSTNARQHASSSSNGVQIISSATPLHVSNPRAVFIVDLDLSSVRIVLDAHSDVVNCICPLPNGGILTGGGKMDATVRVWDAAALSPALRDKVVHEEDVVDQPVPVLSEADKLDEPGYVFDLKVLPDSEPASCLYAIAGARYNVVKVIL